jgi:hypothetical protein
MGLFMRPEQAPVTASAQPLAASRRHATAAAWSASRPLVAAAEQIQLDPSKPDEMRNRPYTEWQARAWEGYDAIGEIKNGFGIKASLLTRIRLYAGVVANPDEAPVTMAAAIKRGLVDERTAAVCKALMDSLLQFSVDLIRAFSLNTDVAGECYLIHLPQPDGTKAWTIVSTDEVQPGIAGYQLRQIRNGANPVQIPEGTFIARIWRKHPRFSKEPDSSLMGVRDPMSRLLLCERLLRTIIRSRLNAGILFVPDTVTSNLNATQTSEPVIEEPGTLDELRASAAVDPSAAMLSDLIQVMSAPITDETNAAALVPMILQGPQDAGEKIRHILMSREIDEYLVKQAEGALDRVLNGIDIPKEIVTGLQQVKYSNAIVIDEGMYKSSIEPIALMLVDALTSVWMRPHLLTNGVAPELISKLVVWYDPTDIVTRPNAAEDATDGFDRGLLSGAAWRREHGFAETDGPNEEELALSLLARSVSLPPEVQLAAARKLLGDVLDIPSSASTQTGGQNGFQINMNPQRSRAEQDVQRRAVQQVGVQ